MFTTHVCQTQQAVKLLDDRSRISSASEFYRIPLIPNISTQITSEEKKQTRGHPISPHFHTRMYIIGLVCRYILMRIYNFYSYRECLIRFIHTHTHTLKIL